MEETKRKRKAAYEETITIELAKGSTYKNKEGEWYNFEKVLKEAKKAGHDTWNRCYSNYGRNKYNTKELFGTTMINIAAPMTDDNCSVILSFTIK